jgi:hypothetical protein
MRIKAKYCICLNKEIIPAGQEILGATEKHVMQLLKVGLAEPIKTEPEDAIVEPKEKAVKKTAKKRGRKSGKKPRKDS